MKYFLFIVAYSIILCGCASAPPKSVKKLDLEDHNANIQALQLTIEKSNNLSLQLEVNNIPAEQTFILRGAREESGNGEERILNLNDEIPQQNALVGPGDVRASYDIQKGIARIIYNAGYLGRFRFSVMPEISFLRVNNSFKLNDRSLSFDLNKEGIGISSNIQYLIYDKLSLNFILGGSLYSGSTKEKIHAVYFRFEPLKSWYFDIGGYQIQLDFEKDLNISYEARVKSDIACYEHCQYIYDGTKNSKTEIDVNGLRIALGFRY